VLLLGVYTSGNGTLLAVGGTSTLTCTNHRPVEEVFWWRDERQIQNDTSKYVIHTNDVNSTLTVYNTGTLLVYGIEILSFFGKKSCHVLGSFRFLKVF